MTHEAQRALAMVLAVALTGVGLVCAAIATGCTREPSSNAEAGIEAAPVAETGDAGDPSPPTFAAIDESLKAGSFDDAAARLLEMRASGRTFTQEEAAEYRRRLNEAYTAALEAADRGDPRAKAAIEMIRANPGR